MDNKIINQIFKGTAHWAFADPTKVERDRETQRKVFA